MKSAKVMKKDLTEIVNKIHCEDAVEFMKKLPSNSVKVIVTSPPYNLGNSTGRMRKAGSTGKNKWRNPKLHKGYQIADDEYLGDNMPHEDYVYWQRRVLREMMRVLRSDGVIFYNHKWRVQGGKWQDRADIVNELPLPVRQIIIWKRPGGHNFNKGYFVPTYEVIYMFAGSRFKLKAGANALGDVWELPREKNNPHPAPFPVELVERCLKSVGSGIVLDPFIGSGTTAIAAENLNRPWIGVDLSLKYAKMAEERVVAAREKRQNKRAAKAAP